MALPFLAILALGLGGKAVVERGTRKGGFLEDLLGESDESKRDRMLEQRKQLISGFSLNNGGDIQQQFRQAKDMLASNDPKIQALGADMFKTIQTQSTDAQKTMLEEQAEANQREENRATVANLSLPQGEVVNAFDQTADAQMREQFDQAKDLLNSQDPRLQQMGADIFKRIQAESIQATQTNETQYRNDLEREMTQYAASQTTQTAKNGAYQKAIRSNVYDPYFKSKRSYENVMQLMQGGDRITTLAALVSFIQSIDDSVVREGELLQYQGQNGFVRNMVETVNKFGGEEFSGEYLQTIKNGAAATFNSMKITSAAKLQSFQTEAAANGADLDKVFAGAPSEIFQKATNDQIAPQIQPQLSPIEEFGHTPPEGLVPHGQPESVFEGVGKLLGIGPEGVQTPIFEGRDVEGAMLDPKTGAVWVPDEKGGMRKLDPNELKLMMATFGTGVAESVTNLPKNIGNILKKLGN